MNCDVIKDLLPLYCDGVCSNETAKVVEEHLENCPACHALLDEMRQEPGIPAFIRPDVQKEAEVLQGVKRKFSLRRRISVLAVALVALVALGLLTAASDVENPIPYQDGLVTAELAVDEAIDIHFFGNHYASFWSFFREAEGGNTIYLCYTQTLKSSAIPIAKDKGHISIGNALMTDFTTACYQVPHSQEINAVYYLEASQENYLQLPQMSDAEFTQATQNAVLLWSRVDR